MARYHAVSYETEARIRQSTKLADAQRHRQLQAARSQDGRSVSLQARIRDGLLAIVAALTSAS